MKCVFLGYPIGVNAYKLWFIEEGNTKFLINRDVSFDETIFPFPSSQVPIRMEANICKENHKRNSNERFQMLENYVRAIEGSHIDEDQLGYNPLEELLISKL